jgi:decaprenylphospho-beta-D-ribofuranose 2-oxidase
MSVKTSDKRRAAIRWHLPALPSDHLENVSAWGMAQEAVSYVYRPSTTEGVRSILQLARERGLTIGLRGAGRSYGDASLNAENICLDLTRMSRILDWNPDQGVIKLEPGVTIGQLWRYVLEDGWWPYVVSGTMYPTIGGAASMNIHGKNNFQVGTIGDHIREFEILLPNGKIKRCNRVENSDLFYAAIGGFGMLGCFLSITLELKRVHSGMLKVIPISVSSLHDMIQVFEARMQDADYLVGWVDCFASGSSIGRGLIHQANYLQPGEDPAPTQTLRVENQELPETFLFGLAPKSMMWLLMKPFVNPMGMRIVNFAKYHMSSLHSGKMHYQTHAEFAFLLDYVPNWKWAYKPGGLIQYQSFIPASSAEEVFKEQINLCRKRGETPLLGVFKRHKPDPFWMTHAVEGYSLAMDFRVTSSNRERIWKLAAELDRIVVEAGGRFYFAKDSTLSPKSLVNFYHEERVQRFLSLKKDVDPFCLFQTNLFRRAFQPLL